MIVDCFTFFNELDILELRLSILDGVVDRFVLCEAPFTFRGDPKPLIYAQNKQRFARWNDRIVHLVYDAQPDANPWKNEWGQRAHLTSGLTAFAPDDLILIGDVDEIPTPEYAVKRPDTGRVLAHRHTLSVGYVNRVVNGPWIGTKAFALRDLGDRSLNDIRLLPLGAFDVMDSGWHFSAIGGARVMAAKMRAYSHTEADIPYLNDERRMDVEFDSETNARWLPIENPAIPEQLRAPRWSAYVWPGPTYDRVQAAGLMHAHGCFASVPAGAGSVAALVRSARPLWQQAGAERFGAAFAGAYVGVPDLLGALPSGGWAVIGDLGAWPASVLNALSGRGLDVVAYASNARSYTALTDTIEGAPFPPGPARGLPELEGALADARFRVEQRYDVMNSVFPPHVFEEEDPIDTVAGAFKFVGTTREAMRRFSTYAYVFKLRSAEG